MPLKIDQFGRKSCQKKHKDVSYQLQWELFQKYFVIHERSVVKNGLSTYSRDPNKRACTPYLVTLHLLFGTLEFVWSKVDSCFCESLYYSIHRCRNPWPLCYSLMLMRSILNWGGCTFVYAVISSTPNLSTVILPTWGLYFRLLQIWPQWFRLQM